MSEKTTGIIVAVVLGIAALTNPPLEAHQHEVEALVKQAKDNSLSNLSLLDYFKTATFDAMRGGKYTSYLVMSKYTVTVGGISSMECYGYFGHVGCVRASSKGS